MSPELDRLLLEIHEQPAVIQRVLETQVAAIDEIAAIVARRDPSAIVLVARGSSDNAAVYGRYLFEVCNHRLTSLAAPSGLTLYGSGPRLDRTLVIGISQSGRGEDVVAYLGEARRQGAPTVALVNDLNSPLAAAAEHVLDCAAGPEVSVPATKTVTAQMTLLAMLACALDGDGSVERLRALPSAVAAGLEQRPATSRLAQSLATGVASVIGRGFAYPPALELALKLKETAYAHAEPFSAADFLHGPVALVESGYCALVLDVGGHSTASALEIAAAISQRGGQPAVLRAGELEAAAPNVPGVAVAAPVAEPFAPIVAVVLGQLVAIELALAQGLDPARPRYLHKVTSTR
jgi:glutamine---fructose-6-phosphate transaminase (isomerizing)